MDIQCGTVYTDIQVRTNHSTPKEVLVRQIDRLIVALINWIDRL